MLDQEQKSWEACSHGGLLAEPGFIVPTAPLVSALDWTMDWMISPESRPQGFTWKKLVTFRAYWSSRCFLTQSLVPAFPWALVLTPKLLSPGNSITFLPTISSLLSLSRVFARTWEVSGRARLFSNVTASPSPPGENIFTAMLTDSQRRKPPSFRLTQPEHV